MNLNSEHEHRCKFVRLFRGETDPEGTHAYHECDCGVSWTDAPSNPGEPSIEKLLDELERLTSAASDARFDSYEEWKTAWTAARAAVVAEFDSYKRLAELWQAETVIRDKQILEASAQLASLQTNQLSPGEARYLIRVVNYAAMWHPPSPEIFSKLAAISGNAP